MAGNLPGPFTSSVGLVIVLFLAVHVFEVDIRDLEYTVDDYRRMNQRWEREMSADNKSKRRFIDRGSSARLVDRLRCCQDPDGFRSVTSMKRERGVLRCWWRLRGRRNSLRRLSRSFASNGTVDAEGDEYQGSPRTDLGDCTRSWGRVGKTRQVSLRTCVRCHAHADHASECSRAGADRKVTGVRWRSLGVVQRR